MAANQADERQQIHSLVDLVPNENLQAVRDLLERVVADELTPEDMAAIDRAEAWLQRNKPIPHDEVLAEFGLTLADFPLKNSGA